MTEQAKTSGKGLTKAKSRRMRKSKNYYALQGTTTAFNKKRKVRKHLRANPTDTQNRAFYKKEYGDPDSLGVTAKGKKAIMQMAHESGLVRTGAGKRK